MSGGEMGIFLAQRLTDGHGDLARTLGKEGGVRFIPAQPEDDGMDKCGG
jgi:hypothetical protein